MEVAILIKRVISEFEVSTDLDRMNMVLHNDWQLYNQLPDSSRLYGSHLITPPSETVLLITASSSVNVLACIFWIIVVWPGPWSDQATHFSFQIFLNKRNCPNSWLKYFVITCYERISQFTFIINEQYFTHECPKTHVSGYFTRRSWSTLKSLVLSSKIATPVGESLSRK